MKQVYNVHNKDYVRGKTVCYCESTIIPNIYRNKCITLFGNIKKKKVPSIKVKL